MAHIPDGFLSAPVVAGTAAAAAAVLALAAQRSRQRLEEREAPVLGAATAFVFAAQMLNFPLGAGTSAHLLGGVLVTAVVGPWSGMLVLFAVVLVQALLFQDGGIAAVGANTLNLAVCGGGGGFVLYKLSLGLVGEGRRRRVGAAAVAAFGSTLLVGCAVAAELALSGTVPLMPALVIVAGAHGIVAVGEAALTAAILGALLRARPDLAAAVAVPPRATRRWGYGVLALAVGLAVVATGVASSRPDVLTAALDRLGAVGGEPAGTAGSLPNSRSPIGGPWVAAAVGVLITFALVWGAVRLARPRRSRS